jgi:ABC-type multidrug transport system ATPase subunit
MTGHTAYDGCSFATFDLIKDYGQFRALKGVSVTARHGTITCLLGPNGAGKSTLIRLIVGQSVPDEGSVTMYMGDARKGTVDASIGYIPDSSMVYPLLTVAEHLRFVEALYDLHRFSQDEEREYLERFGLDEHADFLASKLSKGLKKRLMLACSIRHDARLFIMDEPFDGLDPDGQQLLMHITETLKQQGRSLFISTHRLDVAERISDHLYVLNHGRVVFHGTCGEFSQLAPSQSDTAQTRFEQAFDKVTQDEPIAGKGFMDRDGESR